MMSSAFKKEFPHGRVVVKKGSRYLQYEDGTPFLWLADTWWFAMTPRAAWPQPFKKIVDVRAKQGFTVMQVVVGYPPEVSLDSENAGKPFLENGSINESYFLEVDKKIEYMVQAGMVPMITGGWGHHIDLLGLEKVKLLWAEIIKRYQKYPVVFCLTGEADIFPSAGYGEKTPESSLKSWVRALVPVEVRKMLRPLVPKTTQATPDIYQRIDKWSTVAEFIKKTAKEPVPLTVHVSPNTTASQLYNNPDWLDIDSFQSGHDYESRAIMVERFHSAATNKPLINLEPWYEQIKGQFGAEDQRYMFWVGSLSGAAGVSYGAHGLWNMATESDRFLAHWGASTWQKALQYTGAEQLANAKKWLAQFDLKELNPLVDIVTPWMTEEEPLQPVAAQCKNNYFIYVPSAAQSPSISVRISQAHKDLEWHWVDLQTFKTTPAKVSVHSQARKISVIGSSDALLWVKWKAK